jgi:hypothetical protein
MAFSVSKSHPFRSLGFYKSSGKHAAPKGWAPEPRSGAEAGHPHRAAHAATSPRLTSPHADHPDTGTRPADTDSADTDSADTDSADTDSVDTGQQAA